MARTKLKKKKKKTPVIDHEALIALARAAYGHRERQEKEPAAKTLAAARKELKAKLVEIAMMVSDDVVAKTTGDDLYLYVVARQNKKPSIAFCIGGEGMGWVEHYYADGGTCEDPDEFEEFDWNRFAKASRSAA